MDAKIEKLSEWAAKDCGFDRAAAHRMLEAHDAGRYDEASGYLADAFCWSAAPWPASRPGLYWDSVSVDLRAATPRFRHDAMNVIRLWMGIPLVTAHGIPWDRESFVQPVDAELPPMAPLKINRISAPALVLTEDQVATWLAARGMVMIDTKELAALKRNGTSGPAPMDGETYRRVTRF